MFSIFRDLALVRIENYGFAYYRRAPWECWESEAEDPLDAGYVRIELTEIPLRGARGRDPWLPKMYDVMGRSTWTVWSEFRISEFPVDRFFLVEFNTERLSRDAETFEVTRWSLHYGAPTLGIGNREIPFELPTLTLDWASFTAAEMQWIELGEKRPADMEVMTAIFRLKDWNPRNSKVG